jgi:hypothetical protein
MSALGGLRALAGVLQHGCSTATPGQACVNRNPTLSIVGYEKAARAAPLAGWK